MYDVMLNMLTQVDTVQMTGIVTSSDSRRQVCMLRNMDSPASSCGPVCCEKASKSSCRPTMCIESVSLLGDCIFPCDCPRLHTFTLSAGPHIANHHMYTKLFQGYHPHWLLTSPSFVLSTGTNKSTPVYNIVLNSNFSVSLFKQLRKPVSRQT